MTSAETSPSHQGPRTPNDDPSVNDLDPPAEESIEGHPLPPPDGGDTGATVPEEDDPAIEDTEQQPT